MSKYRTRRTVFTHVGLMETTERLIAQIDDEEPALEESNSLAAIVFLAFSLEAYLNYLGSHLYSSAWSDHFERALQPAGKLALLAGRLCLEPDFERKPYQSFTLVFKIRNRLAHGKTELIEGTIKGDDKEGPPQQYPLTQWELEAKKPAVERMRVDVRAIIEELQEAAGFDPAELQLGSEGEMWRE